MNTQKRRFAWKRLVSLGLCVIGAIGMLSMTAFAETGTSVVTPNTGDDSNLTLWIALAAGAVVVIVLLLFLNHRRSRK